MLITPRQLGPSSRAPPAEHILFQAPLQGSPLAAYFLEPCGDHHHSAGAFVQRATHGSLHARHWSGDHAQLDGPLVVLQPGIAAVPHDLRRGGVDKNQVPGKAPLHKVGDKLGGGKTQRLANVSTEVGLLGT